MLLFYEVPNTKTILPRNNERFVQKYDRMKLIQIFFITLGVFIIITKFEKVTDNKITWERPFRRFREERRPSDRWEQQPFP